MPADRKRAPHVRVVRCDNVDVKQLYLKKKKRKKKTRRRRRITLQKMGSYFQ